MALGANLGPIWGPGLRTPADPGIWGARPWAQFGTPNAMWVPNLGAKTLGPKLVPILVSNLGHILDPTLGPNLVPKIGFQIWALLFQGPKK